MRRALPTCSAVVATVAASTAFTGSVEAEVRGGWTTLFQTDVAASGWVGLQVDFIARSAAEAQSGRYTVVIGEVDPGSPAWHAGVQTGDTLVSINGAVASPSSFQALRKTMRAGDEVRLGVQRTNGQEEIAFQAGVRPFLVLGETPGQMVVRIDSLRTVILRNAESFRDSERPRTFTLRVGDVAIQADSFITVLEAPEVRVSDRGQVKARSSEGTVQAQSWTFRYESPSTPQSFEARIVQSPRTDSVLSAMATLRAELALVQRVEVRMQHDLIQVHEAQEPRPASSDPSQRQRLDGLRTVLLAELEAAEGALRELSREELGSTVASGGPRVEVLPQADPEPPPVREPLRPSPPSPAPGPPPAVSTAITPYVVGRNYLAGAEVTTLQERLAVYFAVDEGVLVTEVAPQTPADEAGLTPGDVIVAVDGRPVRTVSELRSRLSRRWEGTVLSVVRKGESRQLVLSR